MAGAPTHTEQWCWGLDKVHAAAGILSSLVRMVSGRICGCVFLPANPSSQVCCFVAERIKPNYYNFFFCAVDKVQPFVPLSRLLDHGPSQFCNILTAFIITFLRLVCTWFSCQRRYLKIKSLLLIFFPLSFWIEIFQLDSVTYHSFPKLTCWEGLLTVSFSRPVVEDSALQ